MSQKPCPHWGAGLIEHGQKRSLPAGSDDGLGQLQVAARRLVDLEDGGKINGAQGFDMTDLGLLGFADVAQ